MTSSKEATGLNEEAAVQAPSFRQQEDTDGSVVVEADVLIAGTGLTGCLTAAALARRGVKVVQIDGSGIYGGAYKSLKLRELCEWVRAGECDQGEAIRTCHFCPATYPPVACAESAATAASRGVSGKLELPVAVPVERDTRTLSAAPAATAGETTAAVLTLPLAGDSRSVTAGISAESHSKVATTTRIFSSVRDGLPGQERRETTEDHADCNTATETVSTNTHRGSSTEVSCAQAFSTSSPASTIDDSAVGDNSLRHSEWVCCFEDNDMAVCYRLHRASRSPLAKAFGHSSVNGCLFGTKDGEADNQRRGSFPHADQRTQASDTNTHAAPWGGSETLFFSSRWYSFFPFKADGNAGRATGSEIKSHENERESSAEQDSRSTHDVKEDFSRARVPRGATDGAKEAETADKLDQNHQSIHPYGPTVTRSSFEHGISSSDPSCVRNATEATHRGPDLTTTAEATEETLLKERLLKCNTFSIDLVPRVLYSDSAIANIFVTCGAAKYVEFRPIDTPVYVGELDADISGIEEQASDNFRSGENKSATRWHESKREGQLSKMSQRWNETKNHTEGWEEELTDTNGGLEDGTAQAGDNSCEEEFSLVQMPLTRSAIFSSSLLSVQEKRLLMKFISSEASHNLNNQFLSAARLWNVGKQAVSAAFGAGRVPAAAPPGAEAGARESARDAIATEGDGTRRKVPPPSETGGEVLMSSKRSGTTRAFQEKKPDGDDSLFEDMSWEEYLELHRLTGKLQLYLSYGVCVSDLPLRRRATHQSQSQNVFPAAVAKRRRTGEEVDEEDGRRETKQKRQDKQLMMTRSPFVENQVCIGSGKQGGLTASEGRARLLAFVRSVGLYENHSGAWLYPLYGTGDLPQALARAASLSGAVYMLNAGLTELRIKCRRRPSSSLMSCCPRSSLQRPPASTCCSSPLYIKSAEMRATGSSKEERESPTYNGGCYATVTESSAASPAGDSSSQEECLCRGGSALFVSQFHSALKNAEVLEAELETGVVVKTRLLLFEADALPPLHERVRPCMSTGAEAHARGGCTLDPQCSGHISKRALVMGKGGASPPQTRNLASGSKAELEGCACDAQASSSIDTEVHVESTREPPAGDACNASQSGLSNHVAAAAPRRERRSMEFSEEDTSAAPPWKNVPSPVSLGELLFPGLCFDEARSLASYAATTEGKIQERWERDDGVESTKRRATIEKIEETLQRGRSRAEGHAKCSGSYKEKLGVYLSSNKRDSVNTTQRGGTDDGLSHQKRQHTQKAFRERPAGCCVSRSASDYYRQASCHLIALCRNKHVLNGPGFRMAVCPVRSRKLSSSLNSSGGEHKSGCNVPFGRKSECGPCLSSVVCSAPACSAGGAQAIMSSAVFDAPKAGSRQDASTVLTKGDTDGSDALSVEAAKFISPSSHTIAYALSSNNAVPPRRRLSASACSPSNISGASTTRRKPESADGAVLRSSVPDHTHLLRERYAIGRDTSGRCSWPHGSRVSCASLGTRVRDTSACGKGPAAAAPAWPVLVLQTDRTCGTAPADYVLLHLSHVAGPGVNASGCTCDESGASLVAGPSTEACEFCCGASDAAGTGVVRKHYVKNSTSSNRGFPRHAAAVEATTTAAVSSLDRAAGVIPVAAKPSTSCLCCKRSGSRPCAMLVYVLRRLLERGKHPGAAAQDCVFVCSYVLHTLRSDTQKRLQSWQLKQFRGAVRKSCARHDVTVQGSLRSDEKQRVWIEGASASAEDKDAAELARAANLSDHADAGLLAVAAHADRDVDLSQQRAGSEREVSTALSSSTKNKQSSGPTPRHTDITDEKKDILSESSIGVAQHKESRDGTLNQSGCLALSAVPSTPLLFLLQEPKACQEVLEALLDERVDIADLIPAHAYQEAEDAAQELKRLSAPYEKLSEIVATMP